MKKVLFSFLLIIMLPMTMMASVNSDITMVEINGIWYSFNNSGTEAKVEGDQNASASYSGDIIIPSTIEYEGNTYPVTAIESYAFNGCAGLTSIEIPGSVNTIGTSVFSGCRSLTSVTVRNPTPISISATTFTNQSEITLYVPEGTKAAYLAADFWKDFMDILEKDFKDVVENGSLEEAQTGDWSSFWAHEWRNSDSQYKGPASIVVDPTNVGNHCVKVVVRSKEEAIAAGNMSNNGLGDLASWDTSFFIQSKSKIESGKRLRLTMRVKADKEAVMETQAHQTPGDYNFYNMYGNIAVSTAWQTIVRETVVTPEMTTEQSGREFRTVAFHLASRDDGNVFYFDDIKLEVISQEEFITFADGNVETLCLSNWDTNGDGKLSTFEAAAVTNLGTVFKYKYNITSFDELLYFKGLTSIDMGSFVACTQMRSITIPTSVTNIGEMAFLACVNLSPITIPKSVTTIGNCAFGGCSSLTAITIPESVTSIAGNAFEGCANMTTMIVNLGNATYDSRDYCNAIIKTATNTLISGCQSTEIPNSVTGIGERAFQSCRISSITIPNSVISIGESAFENTSLISVSIPNSVTSIAVNAFSSCSALTSIEVDVENPVYDSRDHCNAIIETASNTLIAGCKSTVFPNSVTAIGASAFFGSPLTSLTIPNGVTSIGSRAFFACNQLTSVTVESPTPVVISSDVFSCYDNATLYIPAGSKDAYQAAAGWKDFKYIVELTAMDLVENGSLEAAQSSEWSSFWVHEWRNSDSQYKGPANIVVDPTNAGNHCVKVVVRSKEEAIAAGNMSNNGTGDLANWDTSFFIQSMEKIESGKKLRLTMRVKADKDAVMSTQAHQTPGDYNYYNMYGDIAVSTSWQTIVREVVVTPDMTQEQSGRELRTIAFHLASRDDGNVFYFDDIKLEVINEYIAFADELVESICLDKWDTDKDGNLSMSEAAAVTDLENAFMYKYNITSFDELRYFTGLTSIANNAFIACVNLKSITIPANVTSIGEMAFLACSKLTSINIPTGVTSIGNAAFGGCGSLTSIFIPSAVTSISSNAFADCPSLSSIEVDPSNNIYDSRDYCNAIIETSSDMLVVGCQNTVIPSSVTSIGEYAFQGCRFTSITVPNSVVSIGEDAFNGSGLTSLVIPSSTTSINCSFSRCIALTSIEVDAENPVYDSRDHCNAIIETASNTLVGGCKNTVIPNTVTGIGERAFYGIPLTSITIPSSVTSIGDRAFLACNQLTSVTVENPTPIDITSDVFSCYDNATLYVPQGTKADYQAADVWKDFKYIVELKDLDLVENGSLEAAQSSEWSSFWVFEWRNPDSQYQGPANIVVDPTNASNHCVKVVVRSKEEAIAAGNMSNNGLGDLAYWDTSFFIQSKSKIESGKKLRLTMRVKADKDAAMGTQAHQTPGDYNYYYMYGDIAVSTAWQTIVRETVVTPEMTQERSGRELRTVAFQLATRDDGNVFYFDDIKLEIVGVSKYKMGDVNHDGNVSVADVMAMVDYILENPSDEFDIDLADINNDRQISVADVMGLVDIVLEISTE